MDIPSTSMNDYSFRSIDDIKKVFPDVDIEMLVDLSYNKHRKIAK